MFNGKINYRWSFSIATLNYQRVDHMGLPFSPCLDLPEHIGYSTNMTSLKHDEMRSKVLVIYYFSVLHPN